MNLADFLARYSIWFAISIVIGFVIWKFVLEPRGFKFPKVTVNNQETKDDKGKDFYSTDFSQFPEPPTTKTGEDFWTTDLSKFKNKAI